MSAALSRRTLLLGLAAASTAAASTATVASADAAVTVAENPELIRLADALPHVYDRYVEARDKDWAISDKWLAVWPLAPDEISEIGTKDPWETQGNIERCFQGDFLWREGEEFPRTITWRASWARGHLAAEQRRLKTKDTPARRAEIAQLKRIVKIAEDYEDECVRVKEACHDEYTAGWKARKVAAKAVCKLVGAIMEQPDRTMAGLLIKAEALDTFACMSEWDQKAAIFEPNKWHGQIAASVLRHAKGGAS